MSARAPWRMVIPAGGLPNTGQRPGRIPRPAIDDRGYRWVTADLDQAGQVVLNSGGAGFVTLAPAGWGNSWSITHIQVSTTTGPADQSSVILYRSAVVANRVLGQTAQGGGDTMAVGVALDYGETIIAVWAGGNPGDAATLAVRGWQEALG